MQRAACRTPRAAATLEAAGDGQKRDLDSLDAVDEQRIPRPVNLRREQAVGEAQRARSSPVVLAAGRRAARVSKQISEWRRWDAEEALGCGGGGGMRRRRRNQPVG
jgi:hypothetical protein